jgi:hypothetical protein
VQTLINELAVRGLSNRVLTDSQLARVLAGSDQRRYHLVNRAMKAGELHRLKRGLYLVDARLRDYPAHPFALAQAFVPGSYVSFETALAHHGWIPEAVRTVASVTPGAKSFEYESEVFGRFTFQPLATEPGHFLELVDHVQVDQQAALVAQPARALLDLVCERKVEWQGMKWIVESLRIETESLRKITSADVRTLALTYKQKRVKEFLNSLAKELGHD